MTKEKGIILTARVISMAFTPFYLPTVGLVALFMFSYMNQMPWSYKFQLLTMVYLLTVVVPTVLIHFYRRHQGWSLIDLGQKERRAVPYVISILCYFLCIYLMEFLHIPHFMMTIVTAALFIQITCAPDYLCDDQCLVENLHPHSRYRWCGRSPVRLCRDLRLQPRVVALADIHSGRHPRYESYDSTPT